MANYPANLPGSSVGVDLGLLVLSAGFALSADFFADVLPYVGELAPDARDELARIVGQYIFWVRAAKNATPVSVAEDRLARLHRQGADFLECLAANASHQTDMIEAGHYVEHAIDAALDKARYVIERDAGAPLDNGGLLGAIARQAGLQRRELSVGSFVELMGAFVFACHEAKRQLDADKACKFYSPNEAWDALVCDLAIFYKAITGHRATASKDETRKNPFPSFVYAVHQQLPPQVRRYAGRGANRIPSAFIQAVGKSLSAKRANEGRKAR